MIYVLYLFIFGFVLTAVIGLFASWIDRKLTARVQYRVGPPLLQPLNDIRPNLVLPGDTLTISEHHRYLDSDEPALSLVQSVW